MSYVRGGLELGVFKALGKLFRRFLLIRHAFRLHPDVESFIDALGEKEFDFARFESAIGYHPKKWQLFLESLLHRSYLQYVHGEWKSNERLEFLGDAVLNFLVAEHLYVEYPTMEEGDLTKVRSRLVNRRTLAQRARELRLSDFLLLSSSAVQSLDSGSESILSDAFEAIIGAIYLDGGTGAAREFVHRNLLANTSVFSSALTDDNYKSALLEYSQAQALGVPRYAILREEGPDHDRRFTVEVFLGSDSLGVGTGRSKKDAEQVAAAQALEKIHNAEGSSQREPPGNLGTINP